MRDVPGDAVSPQHLPEVLALLTRTVHLTGACRVPSGAERGRADAVHPPRTATEWAVRSPGPPGEDLKALPRPHGSAAASPAPAGTLTVSDLSDQSSKLLLDPDLPEHRDGNGLQAEPLCLG